MRLNEIDFLRPILFVQLFFVHAFTIYTVTSWEVPAGIESIALYDWIARIAYSCMLELFTFISGYVYYFVSIKKNESFRELAFSKFKRLIIPSILFSLLYYFLLMDHRDFSVFFIYEIICGEGHLWYLPMLFGCFILAYYLKNVNRPFLFLICAFIISSFSRCPNIFRISQIAYYYFFFCFGYFICRYRENIVLFLTKRSRRKLLLISILFIFSLLLLALNVQLKTYHANSWIEGYFVAALIRFINIVYSSIGIVFWYTISIHLAQKISQVPSWVKEFNVLSMGVYVFHQFVLMFLYYYTSLPEICGSYYLPWIAIIIALPSSVLLSYIIRLSNYGKTLI